MYVIVIVLVYLDGVMTPVHCLIGFEASNRFIHKEKGAHVQADAKVVTPVL